MPSSGYLSEFLSQLNAEERKRFDGAAHTMRVVKGQMVIGQGLVGTDVFFIDEGALQVLIYSKNGKQVLIRPLVTGEVRALVQQGLLEQLRRELVVRDVAELSRLVRNAVGDPRVLPVEHQGNDGPRATGSRRSRELY